jgi:hypothetical protein
MTGDLVRPMLGPLRKQDRKWLDHIRRMTDASGMYPGDRCDLCPPAPLGRLYRRGLVTIFFPHNGAHKERWVITPEGRAALTPIPKPETSP